MEEEIIKPCKDCGVEIDPFKTDYSPSRMKCSDCIKKGYVIRQKKVRDARRKILIDLGLTVSLDNCLYCNKSLPSHKPKFCSKECNRYMMKLRTMTANLENMKVRKQKLRNEESKMKRDIKKLLELRKNAGKLNLPNIGIVELTIGQ